MKVEFHAHFLKETRELLLQSKKAKNFLAKFQKDIESCRDLTEVYEKGYHIEPLTGQKPYCKVKYPPFRLIIWIEKPDTIHISEFVLRDSQTYGKKNRKKRK